MKNKSIRFSLILLLLLSLMGKAQESGDFNQYTRLAALAKVWGFLKYYHPRVKSGDIDWEYSLVKAIPKVKTANTKEAFDEEINAIIQNAGDINFLNFTDVVPKDPEEETLFHWIMNTTHFSWRTIMKLEILRQNNDYDENHHYVQYCFSQGNTCYEKEKSHTPPEYRLLALFRYWNIIHYFFPYKSVMDYDWEETLLEFIPRFMDASDDLEYNLVFCELTTRICDGHAYASSIVLNDYWGRYFPPFVVRYVENKTVVTELHAELLDSPEDIKIGDIILKANGVPIEDIRSEKGKYRSASNDPWLQYILNSLIFRGHNDTISLTVDRDDRILNTEVRRYAYDEFPGEDLPENKDIWRILDGNIGYIHMGMLKAEHVETAMLELANTKAIIFDIRNYPNLTLYEISRYLNPELKDFFKYTYPNLERPGYFVEAEGTQCGPSENNPYYYKGKVILLVDERTISQAEFTCMAIQTAPDVTVIGSQTAGADGNVSSVIMPGSIYTGFSGIGIYYPDGSETQRIGIVPDIEVKPTLKGIREGRDEVLEQAIEFINKS
jgi:carboxyl-terminal processing protease